MTRGRPPVKAVKEAMEMAKSRGGVWEVPEHAGLPFDFVCFSGFCTWFVKVRRTRSNVSAPQEIPQLCSAAIRGLRTMPESAVSSRELWASHPTAHGSSSGSRQMRSQRSGAMDPPCPGPERFRRIRIPYSR